MLSPATFIKMVRMRMIMMMMMMMWMLLMREEGVGRGLFFKDWSNSELINDYNREKKKRKKKEKTFMLRSHDKSNGLCRSSSH